VTRIKKNTTGVILANVRIMITDMEVRYGDGAGNTVEEDYSIFSLIRMRYLPSVLSTVGWAAGRASGL